MSNLVDTLVKKFPRKVLAKVLFEPLKERSDHILKLWFSQCEFIFAQRLRRGQQLYVHYRKLWKKHELMLFLLKFKKTLNMHAKGMLLMSMPLIFDWSKERISNEVIAEQMREIDYVQRLKQGTIYCAECKRRRVIDRKMEGIVYCTCRTAALLKMDEWEPYLERKDIIVWRKQEGLGQWAYKVYGSYKDVTAEDFFFVQTNVDYRKEWDKTAIALDIVDCDQHDATNSQVIYWEMLWPKLFANRDYVFKRRTLVDRKQHLMIIVNQSTNHPRCPIEPSNQRVNDYWSHMVIKPHSTFRKPGVEFVLTYFDNPGIVIPPTVTTWVAKTQMPEFLAKLHTATVRFAASKTSLSEDDFEDEFADEDFPLLDYFWNYDFEPGFEYPPERELVHLCKATPCKRRDGTDDKQDRDEKEKGQEKGVEEPLPIEEEKTERKWSWWSYLHPYYYFV